MQIGEKLLNSRGQKYVIVGLAGKNKSHNRIYRLKFLNTGYEREATKVEMLRGMIKDRYEPSVFGVGALGDVRMVDHRREYAVWNGMIDRCYNKQTASYVNYGGKGVRICEDWKIFENFVKDIANIQHFDRELFDKGLLQLDKDIKQQHKSKSDMVYSLTTCMFVSRSVNSSHRDLSGVKLRFIATSPEGVSQKVAGLRPFSEKTGMHRVTIKKCLSGERNDYNGWTFELL